MFMNTDNYPKIRDSSFDAYSLSSMDSLLNSIHEGDFQEDSHYNEDSESAEEKNKRIGRNKKCTKRTPTPRRVLSNLNPELFYTLYDNGGPETD